MAARLSDRDRKLLWGRSGSLCAICRVPLIVRGNGSQDAILGEEAHIVGRSPSGPRGHAGQVGGWSYDNFILLCPTHHSIVDAQPASYTESRLGEIKHAHEHWVASQLAQPIGRRIPQDIPQNWPLWLSDREDEYRAITDVAEDAEYTNSVGVAVLAGLGGVGKSALSSDWFMRQRHQFSGGQLLGSCSRKHEVGRPMEVSEILAYFLREMGIEDNEIPVTLEERYKLYRQATVDRKLLLLLDDVEYPAQVTSLLPTGPGSLVIVTSQHRMEELLFEGARAITVRPLDAAASRRLLEERLGSARLETESLAVDRLIELCGGLPVTLCVCAAKASGDRSIDALVERIERATTPLLEMSGDSRHSIQAVLDLAFVDLSAPAQTLYQSLGLFEGGDFVPAVATVLSGLGPETAAAVQELEDSYLLEPLVDGYRQHDLIHRHAAALASSEDGQWRRSVLVRLVDWYFIALANADRAVTPDRLRLADESPVETPNSPAFATTLDAFGWVEREWRNVAVVIRQAFDIEYYERVWRMAEALWPFCYNQKRYSLWTDAYALGVEAAVAVGNDCAEARMRASLARAFSDLGEFNRAAGEMERSVDLSRHCENEHLKASVTEFDAIMRYESGDASGALGRFQQARAMFVTLGLDRGRAIQDYQIGKCLLALGAAERAVLPLQEAEAVFAAIGDEIILGRVLRRQGEALIGLGRHREAETVLERAVTIAQQLDLRHDLAQTLETLADLADAEEHAELARSHREEATRLYQALGHPRGSALLDVDGREVGGQAS